MVAWEKVVIVGGPPQRCGNIHRPNVKSLHVDYYMAGARGHGLLRSKNGTCIFVGSCRLQSRRWTENNYYERGPLDTSALNGGTVMAKAMAPDPAIGVWKLDLGKSCFRRLLAP